MSTRKKILITGAAGKVGTALRRHLADRYDLRLLVHSRVPDDVRPGDEVIFADVTSYAAMVEIMAGVDVVVHLALGGELRGNTQAEVTERTFEVDMKGSYNVFEAARVNGVSTVIFSSTNHVTGINEQQGIVSSPDQPVRPDSIYGVGKAFVEALGRFYVDVHGMRVFCLRIANFNGREDDPGRYYEPGYSRWLSPRDLAQLVIGCIETESLNWGIFYGVSKGAERKWDLGNARELLGYEPQDEGSAEGYRQRYAATRDPH